MILCKDYFISEGELFFKDSFCSLVLSGVYVTVFPDKLLFFSACSDFSFTVRLSFVRDLIVYSSDCYGLTEHYLYSC